MTRAKGFTLIESLLVTCVTGLLFISGLPALANTIEQQRLASASSALIRSLQIARTTAVLRKATICVANKNSSWASGWQVFVDTNRNCYVDDNEEVLFEQNSLSTNVEVVATQHAQEHVIYNARGDSEQLDGGFQADSLYFCPKHSSLKGIRVVISRGGRVRSEKIPPNAPQCNINS